MSKHKITKEQKKDRGEAPLCACGCGGKAYWNAANGKWNRYSRGHKPKPDYSKNPTCECGCGKVVKWNTVQGRWNRFVHGHHVTVAWRDPQYRLERSEDSRRIMLEQWADPEIRERRLARIQSVEYKNRQSELMKQRWQDSEYVEKRKIAHLAAVRSSQYRELQRRDSLQRWRNPDFAKKQSELMKQKWQDSEYVEKRKIAHLAAVRSPQHRAFQRRNLLEQWRNPELAKKRLAGAGKRPNLPESFLNNITPDKIRYVGDRSWWRKITIRLLNGEYIEKYKNPDFKVTGQNKVIEIWGKFWHRDEVPEDLIEAYQDAGLQCLVIWEHELYADTESVLQRVAEFISEDTWQMSLPL